jgi:hypothetical protein
MSYSAALELVGDVPQAVVPRRIDRASIALNHGLLLGELLGISIGDAQRVLDDVPDREEPTLTAAELAIVRATYRAIRAALDLATTPDGRAAESRKGDALRASDLIEADPSGVLAIRHRRMPIPELRASLEAIDRMIGHALDHRGTIRLDPT